MHYRGENMESQKSERGALHEIVSFWMDLGRHKETKDYVKEWVKPKPASELEKIIRKRGSIV
jgi:hypothetical protein